MAVRALDQNPGLPRGEKVSSFLVTEPYGGVEQDDFLNACLILRTFLPPLELLDRMRNRAGRPPGADCRWGPGPLDLDILMYDDLVLEADELVIPTWKYISRTSY